MDNWELVTAYVPEEDINLINITFPYELKKCLVFIKAQATGVTSNNNKVCAGFSKSGGGGDIDFNNAPDVNSVNARTFGAYCEANGTIKHAVWLKSLPDYGTKGYVTHGDAAPAEMAEINSDYITNFAMRINVSGALFDHTKTTVHVMGVRK